MVMDTATDAVIIGNPNSGRAGDEDYLERFAKILRSGGLRWRYSTPNTPTTPPSLRLLQGTGWSWPPGATARSTRS